MKEVTKNCFLECFQKRLKCWKKCHKEMLHKKMLWLLISV
jgi:hypothetical protein